ncbi:MAG: sporulation protein YunB [Thermoanaerobacteraceae bacterium]|nr:sporulation protein YunB [Thermoanaerobacteraceae bacterium]
MRRRVKRRRKRRSFFSPLTFLLLVLVCAFLIVEFSLKPTIIVFSEAEARWRATEAINQAVLETIVEDMDYEKLVYIQRNEDNEVIYMQQNLAQLNKINTKATLAIQKSLEKLKNRKFAVPLGQLTGSKLLANYGPNISLWLLPLGTVSVKVQDRFEDAGINQTRHKIYLKVQSDIRVVIPLIESKITVTTQVPVADTVIVGAVPETYMKIDLNSGGSLFEMPK